MLRSLYSGITGINVSGMAMSVIGDNLANSQTAGFKRARPVFEDLIAQNIASRTSGNQVGLGATTSAIWRDFTQGAIQNSTRNLDMAINGQGFFVLQNRSSGTGSTTTTGAYYTRAGNFDLDRNGYVTNPAGYILQGWTIDQTTGARGAYGNVQVANTRLDGEATSEVFFSLNLNPNETANDYYLQSDSFTDRDVIINSGAAASFTFSMADEMINVAISNPTDVSEAASLISTALGAAAHSGTVSIVSTTTGVAIRIEPARDDWSIHVTTDNTTDPTVTDGLNFDRTGATSGSAFSSSDSSTYDYTTSINIYDGQGNPHAINYYFRKTDENEWQWFAVSSDSTAGTQMGTLTFSSAGALTSGDPGSADFSFITGVTQTVAIDFSPTGSYGATSQNGNSYVSYYVGQDGYAPGSLESLQVNLQGVISGIYSNGEKISLAQVALARFQNEQGLQREGGTLLSETRDSGEPVLNIAEEGGNGSIFGNAIEESNVDLAEEFVQMIVAQRSFQANSKVISTSDQLLAELMNIRR